MCVYFMLFMLTRGLQTVPGTSHRLVGADVPSHLVTTRTPVCRPLYRRPPPGRRPVRPAPTRSKCTRSCSVIPTVTCRPRSETGVDESFATFVRVQPFQKLQYQRSGDPT